MKRNVFILLLLFISIQLNFAQGITPTDGDIIFTQVGADPDNIIEFITLVDGLDLTKLKITDNGINSSGGLGSDILEGTFDLSTTGWTDIPGGTFVRLGSSITTIDNDPSTDRLLSSTISAVNFSLNDKGDQIIAYTGLSSSPTFIAGINFASSKGWETTKTIDENTSYAPGTTSDVVLGNRRYFYFNPLTIISGDKLVVQTAVTDASNWTAASSFPGWQDLTSKISDAALPVELTSFTASTYKKGVKLNWQTATEVNNYGFSIERKAAIDKSEWDEISFVEGHGNSNAPKEYSFIDASPVGSNLSYRLKQIDTDGAFEYSDVVEIALIDLNKTELHQNHPNPFNPTTSISFSLSETAHVNITIYNAIGQEVADLLHKEMVAGVHNVNFDASSLASGFYFYRIDTPNYSKTMKMMLLR